MPERRVGLWLIGALGGIGSTVALGLSALSRQLTGEIGLVTARPEFSGLDLDAPAQFTLGGHDIRAGGFYDGTLALAKGAGVFDAETVAACRSDLDLWSENLRPGTLINCGETIASLADRSDLPMRDSPAAAISRIKDDLAEFHQRNRLDQLVVVNIASTEPPVVPQDCHSSLEKLEAAIDGPDALPVSSLYAYAAIDSGAAYVNFTPSTGANLPAIVELARKRSVPIAGQDGKTGETLLKSVLAPMFAHRNLRVLSWVGHNILGNRDGQVLRDPRNKSGKLTAKDRVVADIVGYDPPTITSIEYVESLNDWKTAWDHVHFEGFLGVKMSMQFTWHGCDSVLAAPLVLDLARLALSAQRQGEWGVLSHLACFFKSPMGGVEAGLPQQIARLEKYLSERRAAGATK